jgi:DNA-binding transcriptional regulator YiaG
MSTQAIPVEDLAELRDLQVSGRARQIRELARVGQSELARDLDVTQAAVAKWEAGERYPRGDLAAAYLRRLRALERLQRSA